MSIDTGWAQVLLGDVATEVTVGHVGSMASEYVKEGIPFLRSQNVEAGYLDLSNVKFVSSTFHARLSKSSLRPGDVVIVRTGKPGATAIIPESLPISNCSDLVIVRPGPNLDSRFLAYYINSAACHHVSSHLVGAVQQHFNVGSARAMQLRLPSIGEQRGIGTVLGTLDDKIDVNRRMNETLQAIARTIFQSWFVNFDPVRAKMEGRAPYGMNAGTTDLFPDNLENIQGKQTPRGWVTSPILQLGELISGGTPATAQANYWGGNIPWASAKDVSQCKDVFLIATERSITSLGLENSATKLIPALASVIVARGATTGRFVMYGRSIAMNQTCYALRSREGLPFYLYCLLHEVIDHLIHAAHGSVFDTITTATFERTFVLNPATPLKKRFEEQVKPLFRRILANIEESQTLAALRDALLPKLLSGELRVKEAETILEAAI